MTPTISAIHQWYCPNCGQTDTTTEAQPHSRFHVCPQLHYLTAPMLPAGTSAKVESHEREDYVGNEIVQLSPEGRPVMSIVTTRDNGQDVVVFAPTASAKGESSGLGQ